MAEFEKRYQLTADDSVKMGKVEQLHFQAILKSVESFLKHGSVGKGHLALSATSPIIFSGDADPCSFDMLERAFVKISPRMSFKIAQDSLPGEIAAKGAAIAASSTLAELGADFSSLPHNL